MKTFENRNVLNDFNPYLFFTNQVYWNWFIPKDFKAEGDCENIFIQFIGKMNGWTSTSHNLLFSIKSFEEFCKKKMAIKKDFFAELDIKLFRKTSQGEMVKVQENELNNFKFEIGYELHAI